MPFFSIFIPMALIGLANSTPLAPNNLNTFDLSKVRLIDTGFFNASAPINSNDIPPECSFTGPRASFEYSKFEIGNGHVACIGHQTGIGADCGQGAWPDQDYDDIINTVAQQVMKDGQFQSSNAGRWSANFFFGTTAIPDRAPYRSYFEWGIKFGDEKGFKWNQFFFNYDGNYMQIQKSTFFC